MANNNFDELVSNSSAGNRVFVNFQSRDRVRLTVSVDLGDINLDGAISFLDVSPFIGILASNTYAYPADCNQDGSLNFLDIAPFIAILSSQ